MSWGRAGSNVLYRPRGRPEAGTNSGRLGLKRGFVSVPEIAPEHSTCDPKHSTRKIQHWTFNTQLVTLNIQHATLNCKGGGLQVNLKP